MSLYASNRSGGGSSGGGVTIYANLAAFPVSATDGTLAVAADTHIVYEYNATAVAWQAIASNTAYVDALASTGDARSIGSLDAQAANPKGLALVAGVLSAQSADATHPGLVNTATQSFAGAKTFTGDISTPNLNLTDPSASSINATNEIDVVVAGNAVAFFAADSSIILGAAANNAVVPLTVEVGSGQTAHIQDWQNGASIVASISAVGALTASNFSGASSGTNTGDVTLNNVGVSGNAKGASLSGQALTLQPASASFPGVLTAADWTTFNSKQVAGNYITALTGDATASGPGSAALTLATVNGNVGSFTNASITVNAKGLITVASSGAAPVTAVSVASANGFAGSSSGGATPALTLSTSITGVLKGNGTAISAATAGTDYSAGTSGLTTGIVKSTTSTGALTIAVAGDFPTLNQNTSGTAAGLSVTLAIGSGGTGVTSVTTAPTASAFAGWDANKNLSAANHIEGYSTTVTAAGTTTLTVASNYQQFFTGTTTQTVTLPVSSTLILGWQIQICNTSTGSVTVNSSGANAVAVVPTGVSTTFTCVLASGTSAASWSASNAGGTISFSIPNATDWVAYTPTFAGLGTPTNVTAQSRRVGDSLEVYAYFVTGTTSATTATMSIGYNGTNSNVTIDTTKIGTVSNASLAGYMIDYGSGAFSFAALAPNTNQSYVNFGLQNAGNAAGSPCGGSTLGSGTPFSMKFSVPIVGWTANQAVTISGINGGGSIGPTVQTFITGAAQTYTTPAGATHIKVRMVGGGGGGSGGGNTGSSGTTGNASSFGTSLLVANGGGAGVFGQPVGGVGGTASLGTGPIGTVLSGGTGSASIESNPAGQYPASGCGGSTIFGGGAPSAGGAAASVNATANTGGGGAGGNTNSTAGATPGNGGGAGGYVEAIISSPLATYSYTVGAPAAGGAAGANGNNGSAGAAGYIEVTEYYAPGTIGTATNVTGIVAIANGGTGAVTAATAVAALGAAPSLNYQSSSASTNISAGANNTWIAHNTSITTPNAVGSLWKVTGSFWANGSATTIAMATLQGQWSTADGASTAAGSPPAIITPTFGTALVRFDTAGALGIFNYPFQMADIIVGPNITVYLTPLVSWAGLGSVTDVTQMTAIRIQ